MSNRIHYSVIMRPCLRQEVTCSHNSSTLPRLNLVPYYRFLISCIKLHVNVIMEEDSIDPYSMDNVDERPEECFQVKLIYLSVNCEFIILELVFWNEESQIEM